MIELCDVTIEQGDFLLSGVNLKVPSGEYAILMGATGSGKTSLIETICGLRQIAAGRIELREQDISSEPPASRNIGYVPQDAALFPTMRVAQQIGFSLELRKVGKSARNERVMELAELLGITHLLNRLPQGLSGGERQRVALARALAFRPSLLCLDEPLSALDDETRHKLIELLKKIHSYESVTALHITHNQIEAGQLGTMRFQLVDGKINLRETDG